jgi:hypothetical protein
LIDIAAASPPHLHPGSDVSEGKTSAKFGGHLGSPRNGYVSTGGEIDRAQDVESHRMRFKSAESLRRTSPGLDAQKWWR